MPEDIFKEEPIVDSPVESSDLNTEVDTEESDVTPSVDTSEPIDTKVEDKSYVTEEDKILLKEMEAYSEDINDTLESVSKLPSTVTTTFREELSRTQSRKLREQVDEDNKEIPNKTPESKVFDEDSISKSLIKTFSFDTAGVDKIPNRFKPSPSDSNTERWRKLDFIRRTQSPSILDRAIIGIGDVADTASDLVSYPKDIVKNNLKEVTSYVKENHPLVTGGLYTADEITSSVASGITRGALNLTDSLQKVTNFVLSGGDTKVWKDVDPSVAKSIVTLGGLAPNIEPKGITGSLISGFTEVYCSLASMRGLLKSAPSLLKAASTQGLAQSELIGTTISSYLTGAKSFMDSMTPTDTLAAASKELTILLEKYPILVNVGETVKAGAEMGLSSTLFMDKHGGVLSLLESQTNVQVLKGFSEFYDELPLWGQTAYTLAEGIVIDSAFGFIGGTLSKAQKAYLKSNFRSEVLVPYANKLKESYHKTIKATLEKAQSQADAVLEQLAKEEVTKATQKAIKSVKKYNELLNGTLRGDSDSAIKLGEHLDNLNSTPLKEADNPDVLMLTYNPDVEMPLVDPSKVRQLDIPVMPHRTVNLVDTPTNIKVTPEGVAVVVTPGQRKFPDFIVDPRGEILDVESLANMVNSRDYIGRLEYKPKDLAKDAFERLSKIPEEKLAKIIDMLKGLSSETPEGAKGVKVKNGTVVKQVTDSKTLKKKQFKAPELGELPEGYKEFKSEDWTLTTTSKEGAEEVIVGSKSFVYKEVDNGFETSVMTPKGQTIKVISSDIKDLDVLQNLGSDYGMRGVRKKLGKTQRDYRRHTTTIAASKLGLSNQKAQNLFKKVLKEVRSAAAQGKEYIDISGMFNLAKSNLEQFLGTARARKGKLYSVEGLVGETIANVIGYTGKKVYEVFEESVKLAYNPSVNANAKLKSAIGQRIIGALVGMGTNLSYDYITGDDVDYSTMLIYGMLGASCQTYARNTLSKIIKGKAYRSGQKAFLEALEDSGRSVQDEFNFAVDQLKRSDLGDTEKAIIADTLKYAADALTDLPKNLKEAKDFIMNNPVVSTEALLQDIASRGINSSEIRIGKADMLNESSTKALHADVADAVSQHLISKPNEISKAVNDRIFRKNITDYLSALGKPEKEMQDIITKINNGDIKTISNYKSLFLIDSAIDKRMNDLIAKFSKNIKSKADIENKTMVLGSKEWKPLEDISDEDAIEFYGLLPKRFMLFDYFNGKTSSLSTRSASIAQKSSILGALPPSILKNLGNAKTNMVEQAKKLMLLLSNPTTESGVRRITLPEKVELMTKLAKGESILDHLGELRYEFILSSPRTLGKALGANAMMFGMSHIDQFGRALVSRDVRTYTDFASGSLLSMAKAIKGYVDIISGGISRVDTYGTKQYYSVAGEYLKSNRSGFRDDGILAAASKYWSTDLGFIKPTNQLRAADEFFKILNYGGYINSELKEAAREIASNPDNGDYFHILNQLMNGKYESAYKAAVNRALEKSKFYTFTQALSSFEDVERRLAGSTLAKVFLPIVVTPLREARNATKYMPGLNLIDKDFRTLKAIKDSVSKGALNDETRDFLAKSLTFGVISAGIFGYFNEEISNFMGSGYWDKYTGGVLTAEGMIRYSMKIGSIILPLELTPLSKVWGFFKDMTDYVRLYEATQETLLPEERDEWVGRISAYTSGFVLVTGANFSPDVVREAIDLSSIGKSKAELQAAVRSKASKKIINNLIRQTMPNFIRYTAEKLTDTQAAFLEDVSKEMGDTLERFLGKRDRNVLVRTDFRGKPTKAGYIGESRDYPELRVAEQLGFGDLISSFEMRRKNLGVLKLDDGQRAEFKRYTGSQLEEQWDKSLEEYLTKGSDSWDIKRERFKVYLDNSYAIAQNNFLRSNPSLDERMRMLTRTKHLKPQLGRKVYLKKLKRSN